MAINHYPRHRTIWALLLLVWIAPLGCDYARMTTDASYDTYEAELPQMPADAIALEGNVGAYRLLGPAALSNPLSSDTTVLARGRRSYGYFCVHCHAPAGNGHGTVGQSFAPLPTDLNADRVQDQSDAELYYKIAYGFRRHPDLSHTMIEDDLWAVIHFIRRMPETADGKAPGS